jgi:hypothetical protein
VAVAVLAADQASKWWVLSVADLARRGPLVLLPVLDFRLVRNTGITFGLLNGSSEAGPLLLALVAIAVVIGLGVWLYRAERPLVACSIGAIAGGAVGNVIDRLRWISSRHTHSAGHGMCSIWRTPRSSAALPRSCSTGFSAAGGMTTGRLGR